MRRFLDERDDLNGLERRVVLHGFALADIGITGSRVVEYSDFKTEETDLEGVFLRRCMRSPDPSSCERGTFYLNIVGKWMDFANQAGSIEAVFNNSTKRERIESYVERADYYEKTLYPDYEPIKIVTAVYREDVGLYLITRNVSEATVDGESYKLNDAVTRLKISLEEGRHTISAGDQTVVLPVYHEKPESTLREGSIVLRNRTEEKDFNKLTASRRNWSKTVKLGDNRSKIDLPEEFTYQDEDGYGNDTDFRPVKLNWSNENVYVITREGSAEISDFNHRYGFGMSQEEFSKVSRIQKFLGKLPLYEGLTLVESVESLEA